jgi:V/A-type H+-transporting ATPase subunit I
LLKEVEELNRYSVFLEAIEPLFEQIKETPDLEFIGLTVRDQEAKSLLREALMLETDGKFEILTSTSSDGTIACLIAIQRFRSERIKKILSEKEIPELAFPPFLDNLPFVEKIDYLRKRLSEIASEIELISMQMESFTSKWGPIYKRVKKWLEERLSLFKASASAFETKMCFFIYGWMASDAVDSLRKRLNQDFSGKVIIEELEIREEDLERIPVMLKNPRYFEPFELFTRILPLPRYTSYDPTPFIGIFFPIFFGMILGDAGYGVILTFISFLTYKKFKKNIYAQYASKILFVASLYSMFFGILYGEFFGELGHNLFGLQPILIDRRTAVIPMLYFAVTVGVVHILLGYILGFSAACKKKSKKEALCKLFSIGIILSILLLVATLFGLFPNLLTRPLILAILFLSPFLLFTGGLLAPLELMKSIGHIISYARIMAIGLTSVMLAFVANNLAGMTGDIVLGTVVAGLLHLLNLVIGVFSPTIHSLRLHYVEFFSKFLESGGRKFEPLKKEGHASEENTRW